MDITTWLKLANESRLLGDNTTADMIIQYIVDQSDQRFRDSSPNNNM